MYVYVHIDRYWLPQKIQLWSRHVFRPVLISFWTPSGIITLCIVCNSSKILMKTVNIYAILSWYTRCSILNKPPRNLWQLASFKKIVLTKVVQNNRVNLPVTRVLTLKLILKSVNEGKMGTSRPIKAANESNVFTTQPMKTNENVQTIKIRRTSLSWDVQKYLRSSFAALNSTLKVFH